MNRLTPIAFATAISGAAFAQNSIIMCFDSDEITLENGSGLFEAGEIQEEEFALVTPDPSGNYSAQIFLSMDAQYTYLGDGDGDGRIIDSSSSPLGGNADAVMVKRHIGAPIGQVGPQDLYTSRESTNDFPAGFEDGDVFRYAGKGVVDTFITEQQLDDAIGGGSFSFELDAICQDNDGNLYVSFAATETVGTNDEAVEDGGIVLIPVDSGGGGITYDVVTGNVTSVTFDSGIRLANEADMNALIAASGVLTSVGGTPSTSLELSGLDIDPNGGTWLAPSGDLVPNLLFTWGGFSNDGAILSTANGGEIATINGTAMGSTIATTGLHIGMLPDGTGLGGIMGLAIIDERPDTFVVEAWPNRVITGSSSLFIQPQVSGATPGETVVIIWDLGPTGPFNFAPCVNLGAAGDWYGLMIPGFSPLLLGITTANSLGYASINTSWPTGLQNSGQNVVYQAVELTPALRFSTPATADFL